jgi:hypothetical protein
MDATRGEAFSILGGAPIYIGNAVLTHGNPSLDAGGFSLDVDLVIYASRAQFTAANVTPARGQILSYAGKRYAIDRADFDASKVILYANTTDR